MSDSPSKDIYFKPKRRLERSPPIPGKPIEGPPEKMSTGSCNSCGTSLRLKGSSTKCCKCQESYHAVCVGQQNEYFQFLESKRCPYICPSCTNESLTRSNVNENMIRDTIRDSIDVKLTSINTTIENSLKNISNNIMQEINERFQVQHNLVTKMISENESKLQSQIDELKNQVIQIKNSNPTDETSVNREITNLQAKIRQSNLMISGVVQTQNENLFEIIKQIGMKLQTHINQHDIKNVYRLRNNSTRTQNENEPRNGKAPKVIVEFVHDHKKSEIFTKYLEQIKNKKIITGRDIGLQDDTRIYINQHLPQTIARIHGRTIELKKEKIIEQAIPKPTHVLIKKNDEWKRIESIGQLDYFLQQE